MAEQSAQARLWDAALSLADWSSVIDETPRGAAGVVGVEDTSPASVCLRIDTQSGALAAVNRVRPMLSPSSSWAVMLDIQHMTPEEIAILVRQNNVYLLDARTNRLTRLATDDPTVITIMLSSGWFHAQDALLVSSPELVAS